MQFRVLDQFFLQLCEVFADGLVVVTLLHSGEVHMKAETCQQDFLLHFR